MHTKLDDDLNAILNRGSALWPQLSHTRCFITGGTGFIGTWLLESLVWLNDHLQLNIEAVVLTRNPSRFADRAPHLATHPSITLVTGDIRTCAFPEGPFSFIIHAATDASAQLNAEDPLCMFDTIVEGTRRTLDFAVQAGVTNLLFLSSGAVYGEQPADLAQCAETDCIGPDCTLATAAYAEGKRAAELLCSVYAKHYGLAVKLARCFAFVGPYLPLDSHFAIGNFIRDALAQKPILIKGDGTPYRSYLYAADLTYWLWTILLLGQTARPYNVGASSEISIQALAERVNTVLGGSGVQVLQHAQAGVAPKRYIPSVHRAGQELGLYQTTTLDQAIIKTARWHGWEQTA